MKVRLKERLWTPGWGLDMVEFYPERGKPPFVITALK